MRIIAFVSLFLISLQSFAQVDRGQTAATGLILERGNPYPIILGVAVGSPAAKDARIKRGYLLLKVSTDDGILDTRAIPMHRILQSLHGPVGSKVFVEIAETTNSPPQRIELHRAFIYSEGDIPVILSGRAPEPDELDLIEAQSSQPWLKTFRTGTNIVQPDQKNWTRIKKGMSIEEVNAIIGSPISVTSFSTKRMRSDYGIVFFATKSVPKDFAYSVWFENGMAAIIEDPFAGHFSTNGWPTTPQIITPRNGTRFTHTPNFLDLRWLPASGEYPMNYTIELRINTSTGGWVSRQYTTSDLALSVLFPGPRPGSWRIRANNRSGYGEWSEFNDFEFGTQ
jgi:hypothetical protein